MALTAARLAVGYWPDLELAARLAPDGAVGTGDGPGAGKQEYENWSRAVARTFDWVRLGSADDG